MRIIFNVAHHSVKKSLNQKRWIIVKSHEWKGLYNRVSFGEKGNMIISFMGCVWIASVHSCRIDQ